MSRRESTGGPQSDLIPVLSSVGLFLVTTAVTQWIRICHASDTHAQASDNRHALEEGSQQYEELKRWYYNRRFQDRLSYEDVHHAAFKPSPFHSSNDLPSLSNPGPSMEFPEKNDTEWNIHQRLQRRSSLKKLQQSTKTAKSPNKLMEPHPNAECDFHPKNRNWRHFEHYNEADKRRHLEKLALQQQSVFVDHPEGADPIPATESLEEPPPQQHGQREEGEGEGDDVEDFEDDKSISTDGSGSSEEEFVWTKHAHHKKHAVGTQQQVAGEDTWPEAIRKRLPSGLSNIFESSAAVSSETSTLPTFYPTENVVRGSSEGSASVSLNDTSPRPTFPGSNMHSTVSPMFSVPSPLEPMTTRTVSSGEATPILTNRQLRRQYNATIMPEKVILIRHGQSMGNTNEVLYSKIPDNAMPLTDLGWDQAREAGKILRGKILKSGETVHFIVSPYVRTVETFHGIVSAWCDPKEFAHIEDKESRVKAWYGRLMSMGLTWNEDSRIREQDFGNYQDPETIKRAKQERHRFGVFYYRFPHGESASDVFDRVSTFLDSLWRSFEMNRSRNYVLVTHGISIRVLLARYFRYTIDQFNILANPRNCEMVVLGHNGEGRLDLEGRCALDVEEEADGKKKVTGYKFHKRLRILPRAAIRRMDIRISPDDK